jgi:uncharacterized RDD family membrane protein YckC
VYVVTIETEANENVNKVLDEAWETDPFDFLLRRFTAPPAMPQNAPTCDFAFQFRPSAFTLYTNFARLPAMSQTIENPYASPAIPAEATLQPHEINVASQNRRFVNFFVDNIVLQILVQGGGFVVGVLYAIAKVSGGGQVTQDDLSLLQVLGFLWGIAATLGYYIVMETLFQRTVAKFLTGTIVVTQDGQRPTFKQIIGRSFARMIPFEPFSFFGAKPIGWHDSLSKTLVIRTHQ